MFTTWHSPVHLGAVNQVEIGISKLQLEVLEVLELDISFIDLMLLGEGKFSEDLAVMAINYCTYLRLRGIV